MLDNLRIEIAYAVLCIIEWIWAISQFKDAFRDQGWTWWPPTWKLTTAIRISAKAAFFTFVGSVWWFDSFNARHHELAIYLLVIVQVGVFIHWISLPTGDKPKHPEAAAVHQPRVAINEHAVEEISTTAIDVAEVKADVKEIKQRMDEP